MTFLPSNAQQKVVPRGAGDSLRTRIDTLKAAVVTASIRPRIKGDTLEYGTTPIHLPANASVEELLKRLPGLQVDPDGTITYNGEKIQHLFVDGQDIFGADPTMVTRNFDASKIAKVQVIDRKSDRSIFTGIDDGSRVKVLNLVIKESAKDGYFGNVQAGGDPQGYYSTSGAFAGFRGKEQFTLLGLASNTGVLGFSGGSGSAGSISFLNGNTDALGASAGSGVPQFRAVAAHYANVWNGPGNDLAANYQYGHYYTQPTTATQSLQTQPDSVYGQNESSQSSNQQDQHWLYAIYDWSYKNISDFKCTFLGSTSHGMNDFASKTSSSFNDTLVNDSRRTINDRVNRSNVGGEIDWRTKISNQVDHCVSGSLSVTKADNVTAGYLYSLNRFYASNGIAQDNDTTDQRKELEAHSLNLSGSVNYIQPLGKGVILGLSYRITHIIDKPDQGTFNKDGGKYDVLIDSLSSHLRTETVNQFATITLQWQYKKVKYAFGNDWVGYNYQLHDFSADSVLRLRNWSMAPRLLIDYTPNTANKLEFYYFTSTQQPAIAQLIPVQNNTDPLHLTIGNPGLKPGFNQDVQFHYSHISNWMLNVFLNSTFISNTISTKTSTDSLGRQVSQPVNVNGTKTAEISISINKKVGGLDMGVHGNESYARSLNYVNAELSRNDAYNSGGGFSLNKYVPNKYALELKTNFTYFSQVSSVNLGAPVHYWTQNHQGSLTIYILKDAEINTNMAYTWQERTSAFSSNTSVLLLNGYIGWRFLNNKWTAKFQVNNLLNRAAGVSRSSVGNVNTQNATNILGRYWMVSLTYHFDKKFKRG